MAQKTNGTTDALKPSGGEITASTPTKIVSKLIGRKTQKVETPFYYKKDGRVAICNIPYYTANLLKLPQVTEEQVAVKDKNGRTKAVGVVKHGNSIKVEHGASSGRAKGQKLATLMVPSAANTADIFHHLKKLNADHNTDINWFQRGTGRKVWIKKIESLGAAPAGG